MAYKNERVEACFEVRKFITRMWEHPLVDQRTKNHRAAFFDKLDWLSEQKKLSAETFFALPVGSTLWITDNLSDHDVLIASSNIETASKWLDLVFFPCLKIDVHGVYNLNTNREYKSGNYFVEPLLTPDEYIFGNIELARQARVQLIKGEIGELTWEYIVSQHFEKEYKSWPLTDNKRAKRYEANLNSRSRQSFSPQSWQDEFEKARKNLQLPDYQTYKDALEQTGGALRLLPRYSAQRIKREIAIAA